MRRRKSNPIEGAAALSEAFHGRPARKVTEYAEEMHVHSALADLGRLLCVQFQGGPVKEIRFDKGNTRLASNEAGTQLYAVGGNQRVDLKAFGVDETKEAVCLGQIKFLEYHTSKHHLGEEDKVPGPYIHRLGEEGGEMPLLVYDTVNCLVSFVGGSYHIDVDMDGKYSAGIRD